MRSSRHWRGPTYSSPKVYQYLSERLVGFHAMFLAANPAYFEEVTGMRIYTNHTDEQLLSDLRAGQSIAFQEIYFRYANKLFTYACSRIRNREDCKELMQETFEGLWKTETNIRQLRPFLFTMLKYKIINYYEKQATRRRLSEHITLYVKEDEVQLEEESEIQNLRSLLNQSLSKLPQRCQDALRMRIDEELSLDEIAARMNVDKGSVKRYLTMAMNYFKKQHPPLYRS